MIGPSRGKQSQQGDSWSPLDDTSSRKSSQSGPFYDSRGNEIGPRVVKGILQDGGRVSPGGTLYDQDGDKLGSANPNGRRDSKLKKPSLDADSRKSSRPVVVDPYGNEIRCGHLLVFFFFLPSVKTCVTCTEAKFRPFVDALAPLANN